MKVLVMGATGFVGKAIAAELRDRSIDVAAIGGPGSCSPKSGTCGIQIDHCIDVTVPMNVAGLEKIEGITAIVHSAGLAHQFGKVKESDLFSVNVNGTENVAKLAARLKVHIILISSVLVYGTRPTDHGNASPVTEDSPCRPDGPYAQSKLAAESVAIKICKDGEIPLTILRPAPIIGEGSKGNFLRLIKLIDKRRFVWLGKGENRKSLVLVDDVAKACAIILEQNRAETAVYNVSGPAMEMREIVNEISKRLSQKTPNIHIPAAPVISLLRLIPSGRASRLVKTIEKWLSSDTYSSEKLRLQYGFTASPDLADAIGREVARYIETK
ncbi:MAG: NAD-dependent epimerase/dehydratase family protein [Pyrinomonadaceae bacterium]